MAFRIEALNSAHHRSGFESGVVPLDRYLRERATQDLARRVASCFVAIEAATEQIVGFYTLAAASIVLQDLPAELTRRLPRYPQVPAARMGRLAVARVFQGQRLGSALLWDACHRAARSEVSVYALIVDAKDDGAEAFYLHHGFARYGTQPRQLMLPLARLKA